MGEIARGEKMRRRDEERRWKEGSERERRREEEREGGERGKREGGAMECVGRRRKGER